MYGMAPSQAQVQGPTDVRPLEVPSAAADLELNLAELENLLATLAARLSPVLSQPTTNQAGVSPPSAGYSCETAYRVAAVSERVRSLRAGASDLLSRLEV